jgi:AmiR/NasT family two-component response regulator
MSIHDVDDLMTEGHRAPPVAPIVHQATGILMVRRGITIDEASAALQEVAATIGVAATQVPATIVSSTNRP